MLGRANGTIATHLAADPTVTSGSENTLHIFAGAEIELPVNLTFQVDLFNLAVSASVFFGKKF